MLTEENLRRGMDPAEARRQAALSLGDIAQLRESHREQRGLPFVERLLQDLRFAFRLLLKDRGYTIAAGIALALGIGANTAVFTIFAAVVLKPLPVPNPEALVTISRTTPQRPGGLFSFADYVYYRDNNGVFSNIAAETPEHLHLAASSAAGSTVTAAEPLMGVFITANYLETFGLHPIAGHGLSPDDDFRTAGPYPGLLSANYFQRRFGGDSSILGQTLTVSGTPVLVVGIAPRDFMGTRPEVPDIWISSSALGDARRRAQDRTTLSSVLTARLRPGVSLAQAQAELNVMASALRNQYPAQERQWNVQVVKATRFGNYHYAFMRLYVVLQVLMALVLLIACTNVAGLFLGRAAARQREIAIRLSIGASRGRIIRQLVTEGVLMALGAGLFSYVFAVQVLSAIGRTVSANLAAKGGTMAVDLSPDLRVFIYVLCISAVAGISFALVPALQSTKVDVSSALKEETAGFGVRTKSRLRGGIIAAQISVCLALLIGAGLLTLQSVRLLSVNPGFDTKTVINLNISSPQELGYSAARTAELQARIEERLQGLPGIAGVAFASSIPLGGNITTTKVAPAEAAASTSGQQQFPYVYVSQDYFKTLGIRLRSGRDFTSHEIATNAPVAVISEALAQRLWPGADPIGKRIALGSPAEVHFPGQRAPFSTSTEVIAVAADIYSQYLVSPDAGAVYLPKPPADWNAIAFIRVQGDPNAATANLIREIHAMEPNLAVTAETLTHMISTGEATAAFDVASIVFFAIGMLGFGLASIGIYSMVAYTVAQQTREVGIRMALGAQTSHLLRVLVGESARWILVGLALGVLVGLGLMRLLASQIPQLFGTPHLFDTYVILLVSAITGGLALLAAYFPARRATRLDPAMVLRFE
jgi:predicted permease